MLSNIATKTVADRWRGVLVGAGTIVGFLLMGMAVYREFDLSLYTNLPEAMRELFGIPADADAAGLAFGAIFGFYGAVTLAGLAIAMGVGSIAGEERDGTIGLLLGNPRSRSDVLTAKAVSTVVLVGLASVVLWAGALATPVLLDVDVSGFTVGALVVHVFANALFYGFLAMMIGAWTGKTGLATGVAAGVMLASYFAVGLLPLGESVAGAAKAFPWYYLDAGDPVRNGIQWDGIAVLLGGAALFAAASYIGVERRDLHSRSIGGSIVERLRQNPRTAAVVDRLAGSTRVSSIWTKTVAEHQALTLILTVTMFGMMGLLMGPMYTAIDDDLRAFGANLPDVMLALLGTADIATPEGWYQLETFSIMTPALVMAATITVGAGALAGEEGRRTMGLLLANPVTRARVVVQKTIAMVLLAVVVGVATFAGVVGGSLMAGLGMSVANIAATSALAVLLGLVFGSLALLLGAVTGRARVAVVGAIGAAFAGYLLTSLLPLTESLSGLAALSPFEYYLTGNPLIDGMPWADAAVLLGTTVAFVIGAIFAFEHRDVRSGS